MTSGLPFFGNTAPRYICVALLRIEVCDSRIRISGPALQRGQLVRLGNGEESFASSFTVSAESIPFRNHMRVFLRGDPCRTPPHHP